MKKHTVIKMLTLQIHFIDINDSAIPTNID